jgi:glutathione S-transferase
MITLYGTTTSPFVRRVRVVCLEKGVACTLVPTQTDEGQQALRAVTPIWKVPVATFADGRMVYDSRVIMDELLRDGAGTLRPDADDPQQRVDDENVINMIDEALLCLVRRFYLQKDGIALVGPWFDKERERAATILQHLEARVVGGHLSPGREGFGRVELVALSAVDWMAFRNTFDLSAVPKLAQLAESWRARPSVAATQPVVS